MVCDVVCMVWLESSLWYVLEHSYVVSPSTQRILLTITIGTMSLFVCRSDPRSTVIVPDRCLCFCCCCGSGGCGCADDVSHKADGETERKTEWTRRRTWNSKSDAHTGEHTNTFSTMSSSSRSILFLPESSQHQVWTTFNDQATSRWSGSRLVLFLFFHHSTLAPLVFPFTNVDATLELTCIIFTL